MKRDDQIMKFRAMLCALVLTFGASKAFAFTECSQKVTRIWTDAGSASSVWIFLDSGVVAVVGPTDPNKQSLLAVALTAMTTSRTVTARFSTDGVSCTAAVARTDFAGMYLN